MSAGGGWIPDFKNVSPGSQTPKSTWTTEIRVDSFAFIFLKQNKVSGRGGKGSCVKITTERDAEQQGSMSVTEPRAVPCAGPCQVLSDSQ